MSLHSKAFLGNSVPVFVISDISSAVLCRINQYHSRFSQGVTLLELKLLQILWFIIITGYFHPPGKTKKITNFYISFSSLND